jgi:hypothetical protein
MLEATLAMPSFRLYAIEDRFVLFGAYPPPPEGPTPFEALPPGYDVDALWGEGADVAALRAELARLTHPNARAYLGWAQASLALRPLLRGGAHDGLRAPASAAERATVTRATDALAHAARVLDDVPVVQAQYAMAALADCRLDAVEPALELAMREGTSREPMLTRLELLRERGETDEVRAVLDALRAEPASAGDPWIAALRRSLADPPRCR